MIVSKPILHLPLISNSIDVARYGVTNTDVNMKYYGHGLFNGSNTYINLGNPSILNLTGQFTFSLWVYCEDTNSRQIFIKWGSGATGYNNQFHLWVNGSNKYSLYVRQSNNADVEIADTITVKTKRWTHLAFVGTSSAMIFYRNGIKVNSVAYSGALNVPASPNNAGVGVKLIGTAPWVDAVYFNGKIKTILVYKRALSASEVLSLYQVNKPSLRTRLFNAVQMAVNKTNFFHGW